MNFLSPAAWWGLAAAVPAVLAEYLYRTLQGSWLSHIYLWIPLQLSIGYCIFRLVTIPNTTLLDAFAVWAFSTIFMRVAISTLFLHDPVKGGTWFALGLIIMARVAQAFWGR
jgi:multidrug transporter EmrE-like cation transporter